MHTKGDEFIIMAGVVLKNVNKIFPGDVKAVIDFNLEIKDKEFVVLVGPSGCGKSTTLRMVAGLEEITSGEIYIGDRLVNDIPPKDRDIAMVFQNYALYPHMNVYDNMAFGLKLRKLPRAKIDARVKEAARILGIEDYLNRKPKALSGGQRQRVALGRAIVREPKVFLMDEPLSNLDAKLRVLMRTELSKLHNRLQTTFIYVTHDQTEAMTMGDRIVVMKDGYVYQVDTPKNIYDHPANIFVASFIGSPQMNFIDVKLFAESDKLYVSFGNAKLVIPDEIKNKINPSYMGKEVVMGIRPEDIHDEPALLERYPEYCFYTNVDVVELMGSETFLYMDFEGNTLTARVDPGSSAQPGDKIKIGFNMNKVHLFDKDTTNRIF